MSDTQNKKKKSSKSDPASPKKSKKKNPKTDGAGPKKTQSPKPSPKKKTVSGKSPTKKKPDSEFTDRLVDKLKKGLLQAYDVGAKVVDELSRTALEYADKYKAESEIKKLNVEKDLLITQLGHSILKHHLEGKVTESFFNEKEIIDQFNQIEKLDKKIIKTGKQLDKTKK